jgi:glycosyltransferase involved in cell wall biosynthesis
MAEKPIPLLIISDAISASTGLARIARDLATRIQTNLYDVYRLATAGYGSPGSCKFGIPIYSLEGMNEWILPSLQEIVEDFAGNERCVCLFVWDPSRLGWFSQPERLASESLAKYPGLKEWLLRANIDRWIYAPLDASGPNDKLTYPIALTLMGFNRILAYGPFGEAVIRRTIGDAEADKRHLIHIPHGICSDVFFERHRTLCRKVFLKDTGALTMLHMLGVSASTEPIADDELLIGCVCTNQARKDLALAAETIVILSKTRRVRFWLHTDRLEGAFSIPSLLVDFGILQNSLISMGYISDQKMAAAYAACDLTIAPGLGEGFGFPLAESLACQTPVIHGSYGGGADFVPKQMQIDPVAFRYEGSYACKRPVYNAVDLAAKAEEWIGRRCDSLDPRYDWKNLWPNEWEPWFREAAR